ncbi:phenylalanine--tRNA ligase subunit beta [Asticcacaulis endophyticus]|uniref:Phenylalanine--tRNA ligase beta subunit n=1 Tax=Asticcacaulis endophyticus TaxID=1395890 RepID=A0A918UPY6_9CAUL|nr:phenylalanine--tRNA ligase subunit beta [Asticcacaulis endophyticus]GGZ25395.1 phenylalanine--tRNA ligase beta subunit [Asticcacaulis endophyticus]
MKFSLSWLKDHLDTDADIHAVANAMTMAGLEVEDIHDPAKLLKPFTVAKVISAAQHPNADRLQVLQVDTVDGRKEIVCGAPNARAGLTTIYAPIGAYVPGLDVTLVEKPVRGVVSNGMMCSASELQLSDESDGILELSDDLAVGTPAAVVFGAEPVIDFEVTPNRPDWLGVHGIARDLAAAGLGAFKDKAIEPVKGTFPSPISVKVDGDACPYFSGRVIRGVTNGPSPKWLQDKLTSIGLKPISTLVDITNYLSFDRARPLHVYDVKKLSGNVIEAVVGKDWRILWHYNGIPITGSPPARLFDALDGSKYILTPDMCVIADTENGKLRPIGIGGIMGGMSTGVSDDTTDVFLECAWFDPIRTAQTGRDTKITSDALYRFARGVDPESVVPGLELATRLILDLCGGEASDIVVEGAPPARRADVTFDPAYVGQLTGLEVPYEQIETILTALGFGVTKGTPWTVSVPSFRRDVDGKADLVEEVARIYGFNKIPSTPLPTVAPKNGGVLTPQQARARTARRALAAFGYSEAVTWSFMRQDWAKLFGGGDDTLVLANPIASELNCMRPSVLPNLLEAAGRNAAKGFAGAQLFEIGPVYFGDEPNDQKTVISAIKAPAKTRHWSAVGEDALFALKSDLIRLLEEINVPVASLQLVQGSNTAHWHPGRSARLQLGPKQVLAEFGELHPSVLKTLDLDGAYVGFEIRLDLLPQPKAKSGKSKGALTISNLMPLTRDFAFVAEDALVAGDLVRAIKGADKALISDAQVFDIYTGAGVAEGHKSVAVEVTLTPQDKTLTDADIEAVSQKIIAAAQKAGATLRS